MINDAQIHICCFGILDSNKFESKCVSIIYICFELMFLSISHYVLYWKCIYYFLEITDIRIFTTFYDSFSLHSFKDKLCVYDLSLPSHLPWTDSFIRLIDKKIKVRFSYTSPHTLIKARLFLCSYFACCETPVYNFPERIHQIEKNELRAEKGNEED